MGFSGMLQQLFWGRRPSWPPDLDRRPARLPRSGRDARIAMGERVKLRVPIASPHTVWIPSGAVGTIVGGDPRARKARVELDRPRTVVTVPFAWLEEDDEPPESPPAEAESPG